MKPDISYARNGDVALAYQILGDGPNDLLLLIGYLSNLEYAWEYPSMAAFLTRLRHGRRLILMDRRGSGLSDPFPPNQAPPLETLTDDVRAVLDAAGSARTALLGVWDGCLVATLFAATYPDRVTSLMLFSGNPHGTLDEETSWGWTPEQWDEWLGTIRQGWGTRAWVVANARWQAPSLMDDPEELDRWIAFSRLSGSPSSAEAVLRLESETDIRPILPTVRVPTLVLSRSGDQAQPIEGGRYLAEKIPNARFVELPGDDALPWIGDVGSLFTAIESFLAERSHPAASFERRLATVLFTDIVASTERSRSLGDGVWKRMLEQHNAILRRGIQRHGGREIGTWGDGFFATFEGPAAATRCAVAAATEVRALGLELRAGVHTGEVETIDAEIGGIGVTIGARIAALAGPSEVLVSSTVKDLTAGSQLVFEDAGEHGLKGLPDRWRLYRVAGG